MKMFKFVPFFVLLIAIRSYDAANLARIVGGKDAPIHKYPYQVSLRSHNKNGKTAHFCGGSVINSQWVLTAGHCVANDVIKNATVSLGTNYLNETGNEYKIKLYVVHEKFKDFYDYDIGLVRVMGEIEFSDYVQPIALARDDINTDYVWAIFTGWGSTYNTGPSSNNLQEMNLTIISNVACNVKEPQVTKKHLCTYTKRSEGACEGDSGGPLAIDGHQVGIASYVTPCAINYPDIYTRVSKYVKWIDNTIDKYSSTTL